MRSDISKSAGKQGGGEGGGVTPPSSPPLSTAGIWTDISRRRERFFLGLGYFLHVAFLWYVRYGTGTYPDPF